MSGYDLYKMIMTQQSFKIPFYEEIFIVSYPSLFFLKQVTEKKFRNVLSRPPPPSPPPLKGLAAFWLQKAFRVLLFSTIAATIQQIILRLVRNIAGGMLHSFLGFEFSPFFCIIALGFMFKTRKLSKGYIEKGFNLCFNLSRSTRRLHVIKTRYFTNSLLCVIRHFTKNHNLIVFSRLWFRPHFSVFL